MKHTTPSPATITGPQLAALTTLSVRRLYQLATDEKKIPAPENGRWPLLETVKSLFSYMQREGENLQRERLRKVTAEAKLAEMKEEEIRAAQEKRWMLTQDTLNILRALMARLEQWPGKLKSEAGLNETQGAVAQKLLDDLRSQVADDIEAMKPAKEGA